MKSRFNPFKKYWYYHKDELKKPLLDFQKPINYSDYLPNDLNTEELPEVLKVFNSLYDEVQTKEKNNFPSVSDFIWSYAVYLILLINHPIVYWITIVISIGMIIGASGFIYKYNNYDAIAESNSFEYLKHQFYFFLTAIIDFGILYYCIYSIDNSQFEILNEISPNILDFIYMSIGVFTVGFLDVIPHTIITKAVIISEIVFTFWFLITVIPITIGLQTEGLSSFKQKKRRFNELIQEGLKAGTIIEVEAFDKFEKRYEVKVGNKKVLIVNYQFRMV